MSKSQSYVTGKVIADKWRCDKHLEFCKGSIKKRMSKFGAVAQYCDKAWQEFLIPYPSMVSVWPIVLDEHENRGDHES